MKARSQKEDDWKVEPLPEPTSMSMANMSPTELLELLAAAYRRIGALESELSRA